MRASKIQFIEFSKSRVWQDLKTLLTARRDSIRDDLEEGVKSDVSPDIEIRETSRLRGQAEELKFILGLPEFIVSSYDNLSEEEEEKEDG